jgi:hypothetical protein
MRRPRLPRATELPALAAFARGYLHQDVIAEYGSAVGAVAAFAEDASGDERRQLEADLERLLRALEGRSATTVARYFGDELGAAWVPASVADVRALLARISHVS